MVSINNIVLKLLDSGALFHVVQQHVSSNQCDYRTADEGPCVRNVQFFMIHVVELRRMKAPLSNIFSI